MSANMPYWVPAASNVAGRSQQSFGGSVGIFTGATVGEVMGRSVEATGDYVVPSTITQRPTTIPFWQA